MRRSRKNILENKKAQMREREAVFRNPGGIFLLQYKMINKAHRQTIKRKLIDKLKKES